MNTLVFDIETGPLPWAEIQAFYEPPPALPPWDDAMVKYGQMKDPGKRQEKYNEVKAKYEAELAAEAAAREAHRCQWASEAALSPVTGCVLMIGLRNGDRIATVGDDGESEAEILELWWNVARKYIASGGRLVGFCSHFFDLPYIIWRSYVHRIEVPQQVYDRNGRYFAASFFDLYDRMPKRGFDNVGNGSRGLDAACRALGLGGKPEGVDGGQFATLWQSDNAASREAAIAYLRNDLDMTWKLAERMGVML